MGTYQFSNSNSNIWKSWSTEILSGMEAQLVEGLSKCYGLVQLVGSNPVGLSFFCWTSTEFAVDFIEKSHFHVEYRDMENVPLPLETTNF